VTVDKMKISHNGKIALMERLVMSFVEHPEGKDNPRKNLELKTEIMDWLDGLKEPELEPGPKKKK